MPNNVKIIQIGYTSENKQWCIHLNYDVKQKTFVLLKLCITIWSIARNMRIVYTMSPTLVFVKSTLVCKFLLTKMAWK